MKKLLVCLLGFFLLISCFSHKTSSSDEVQSVTKTCSECKVEYMECIKQPDSLHARTVEKAADKYKANEISKTEYEAECEKSYVIYMKKTEECGEIFEKCCLGE